MKVNFKFTNIYINLNSLLNKDSKIHETIIDIIFFWDKLCCFIILKKSNKLLHYNCLFGMLSIYINIQSYIFKYN